MAFVDSYCGTKLAKRFAGDIEGTEDDSLFYPLIQAASRFVDNYTNRYWGPSAFISGERIATSRIIGSSFNVFYTKYAPIISVQSLADDTTTWVENTDFVTFYDEGKVELFGFRQTVPSLSLPDIIGLPRSFSRKAGAVQISYTIGQGPAPTGGSGKPVEYIEVAAPADIQLATAMIAGAFYKDPEKVGIASKSESNEQVVYDLANDLPKRCKMLLDLRRRHIP